jgi:hypothetical protein
MMREREHGLRRIFLDALIAKLCLRDPDDRVGWHCAPRWRGSVCAVGGAEWASAGVRIPSEVRIPSARVPDGILTFVAQSYQ